MYLNDHLKSGATLDIYCRHWRCSYKVYRIMPISARVSAILFCGTLVILTTVMLSHLFNVENCGSDTAPRQYAGRGLKPCLQTLGAAGYPISVVVINPATPVAAVSS